MTRGNAGAAAAVAVVAGALAVVGAQAKPVPSTVKVTADPHGNLKFDKKKLTAAAGAVTLNMVNPKSSGISHGIGVKGNGVDKDGKVVKPGKTSMLTVKLKAGKYTFYCPVSGHAAAGMKGTLTVK